MKTTLDGLRMELICMSISRGEAKVTRRLRRLFPRWASAREIRLMLMLYAMAHADEIEAGLARDLEYCEAEGLNAHGYWRKRMEGM